MQGGQNSDPGTLQAKDTQQDWVEVYLSACYAYKGDTMRAQHHVVRALRLEPGLTVDGILSREPYLLTEDRMHLSEGMKLAGLR